MGTIGLIVVALRLFAAWGQDTSGQPPVAAERAGDPEEHMRDARSQDGLYRRCVDSGGAATSCWSTHGRFALSAYEDAFRASDRTNLPAARSGRLLAEEYVRDAGLQCRHPDDPAWGGHACDVLRERFNLQRMDLDLDEPAWYRAVQRAEAHRTTGRLVEAADEFKVASTTYLRRCPAGRDDCYARGFYLLNEAIEATSRAVSGPHSGAGVHRVLVEQLRGLGREYGKTCHAGAPTVEVAACETEIRLRVRWAHELRMDHLYRESADQLETSYRTCAALHAGDTSDAKQEILHCWRTYGRSALGMRRPDIVQGGYLHREQHERALRLLHDFVADMGRACGSSQQRDVEAACGDLQRLEGLRRSERRLRSVGDDGVAMTSVVVAPTDSVASVAGRLAAPDEVAQRDASVFLLKKLEEAVHAEVFDRASELDKTRSLRVDASAAAVKSLAESRAAQCELASAGADRGLCDSLRLYGRIRERRLFLAPEPAPPAAPRRSRLYVAGVTTTTLGAAGLAVGFAGLALGAHEYDRMWAAARTDWSADAGETRGLASFRRGEWGNRMAIGGLSVGGALVIVGVALLVSERVLAGRRRRVETCGLGRRAALCFAF